MEQGIERQAYEKEKPRLGYVVRETRTHGQRVRQLPMNQLSCVRIDPRISDWLSSPLPNSVPCSVHWLKN